MQWVTELTSIDFVYASSSFFYSLLEQLIFRVHNVEQIFKRIMHWCSAFLWSKCLYQCWLYKLVGYARMPPGLKIFFYHTLLTLKYSRSVCSQVPTIVSILTNSQIFISSEAGKPNYSTSLTDEEWRKRLTKDQYYITRQKGTERAFTGYDCFTL